VQVALHRKVDHLARAAARHDHGTLVLERQHFFDHAGHLFELGPGRHQLGTGFHADLALAVITQAGGLEDAWQQLIGHRRQLRFGLDHGMRRHGHAAFHKMRLLGGAVLRNGHSIRGRGHETVRPQGQQGRGRDVLKFGGDGGAALHQLRQALLVQVIGLDVMVTHPARRTGRIGVKHRRVVAHGLRGMHKHAAQLAAPHDAQGGGMAVDHAARKQHAHLDSTGGKVMARAIAVCSARKASSWLRKAAF